MAIYTPLPPLRLCPRRALYIRMPSPGSLHLGALSAAPYAFPRSGRVLSRGLLCLPSAARPAPAPAAVWVSVSVYPPRVAVSRGALCCPVYPPPVGAGIVSGSALPALSGSPCPRFKPLKIFFRFFSQPPPGLFFSEKNRRPARTYVRAQKIVAPRAGVIPVLCLGPPLYSLPSSASPALPSYLL